MSETLGAVLRNAIGYLTQHRVAEPGAAAEVLLADLLHVSRPQLYLDAPLPLSTAQQEAYHARLTRRMHGEPVQYITGTQEFWSLAFDVNPQVLIPRPESELLVEHGIRVVQQWCQQYPHIPPILLDVGTGSGNLAISLAHTLPQSQVWGIDCALATLRVAQQNAQRLDVAERVHWVCGELLTALRPGEHRFALCVGNLPYVTTAEWHALPPEIRDHEPPGALLGGEDGLELIRRVISVIPDVLAPAGTLLLEVGWQQAAAVGTLLQAQGCFQAFGVYQDFAGIDRVVWAHV
jgi:release factor glutamine methyltransferase